MQISEELGGSNSERVTMWCIALLHRARAMDYSKNRTSPGTWAIKTDPCHLCAHAAEKLTKTVCH